MAAWRKKFNRPPLEEPWGSNPEEWHWKCTTCRAFNSQRPTDPDHALETMVCTTCGRSWLIYKSEVV